MLRTLKSSLKRTLKRTLKSAALKTVALRTAMPKTAVFLPAIFLIVLIFLSPCLSHAGFVDEWITQKTETDAGYFEGQKRGYFTGGSFSARWPVQSDYPVTFEPPRLKFGCGGIDAYMGGFSFLNFEYLVQKLQRIMTAAPAAAFDMALNTLCPQCSNTIKSLEEIANTLNSIQINDCQAGKTVAAKLMTNVTTDPTIKAEADKEYNLLKGLYDLPQKISDIWKSSDNKPASKTNEKIAGCPIDLKNLMNSSRTLFEVAADGSGISSDTIATIRGMFGDMVYTMTGDDGDWKYIPPCEQNDLSSLNQLYTGAVYKRSDPHGGCSPITDEKKNIFEWAGSMITSIANKIQGKGNLTSAEEEFIRHLPAPVYSTLKTAIMSNQVESTSVELKDIAARGYAYQIFSDIISRVAIFHRRIDALISNKGGKELADCQSSLITAAPDMFSQKGMRDMLSFANLLKQDYLRTLSESETVRQMGRSYEDFEKITLKRLSEIFSPGVAKRVMKK